MDEHFRRLIDNSVVVLKYLERSLSCLNTLRTYILENNCDCQHIRDMISLYEMQTITVFELLWRYEISLNVLEQAMTSTGEFTNSASFASATAEASSTITSATTTTIPAAHSTMLCPICMDRRVAVIVRCGHTFCLPCIRQIRTSIFTVKCSICRDNSIFTTVSRIF